MSAMSKAPTSSAIALELGKVDDPWVGGGPAQDHGGAEDQRGLAELVKIDEAGLGVHLVGQRLKVDRRRGDLL